MRTLKLEILSPEGKAFSGPADRVTIPTAQGQITVMPGHVPLFAKLAEGEVIIFKAPEPEYVTITGGFVEISEHNISILADFAQRSDAIQEEQLRGAKRQAEEALKNAKEKEAIAIAEKDLRKIILELKVTQKIRKRKKS